MKKIKKLLVALEQSDQSENILNHGKSVAGRCKADMILLHVIPSEMRYEEAQVSDVGNGVLPSAPPKFVEAAYLQAYGWLESIRLRDHDKSINTDIQVLVALDSVPTEIVNYAELNKIDLIIIGTREKTGSEKMLLGSVASHVTTHAHCPVLVIR